MSKEIVIQALENDRSIVAVVKDNATVRDILNHEDVLEAFDVDDAQEIVDAFAEFNGAEVPEALAATMLGVVPNTNDTIGIDLPMATEDAEDEDAEGSPAAGGTVTIYTVGGQQTTLNFEGRMTVREAVTSDCVQLRSRQSKAQLSACPVVLNGEPIEGTALDSRLIADGDVIVLSPARNAGTKGNN